METEKAIEFLYSIKGKTVYLVGIIDGKVDNAVYQPITLDDYYCEQLVNELLVGLIDLKSWQHRFMRDFEHYVLYFIVNE